MKILLTSRREKNERRNPIALLDLAAFWRSLGHTVDCYYLDQLGGPISQGRSYDLAGLSVLQVIQEKTPLYDALWLQKKFKAEVVVGGKWTRTIGQDQKEFFSDHGIKVHDGPGEHYFQSGESDFGNYPPWDRVDFETLRDVRGDIMSTRGCPYHCHFCHNTEKKISFFNAERTAANVALLFHLGAKRISFCDDVFTLSPGHMEKLYHALKKRNISIEHRSEFFTHINHIHPETIRWMKVFKPFRVNVGIESGDNRMLLLMGKGFDRETAFQNLKMLHDELQVTIGTLFLIGFPGETEESLKNTLDFILRIRIFAGGWVSYYQPVRGTKGYEMAIERSKSMKLGRRNTAIPYVDPNLTKKLLFKYHYQMMDFSSPTSTRRRLIYPLIDVLPYWLLAPIRQFRQNKRLRNYMDHTFLPSEKRGAAI